MQKPRLAARPAARRTKRTTARATVIAILFAVGASVFHVGAQETSSNSPTLLWYYTVQRGDTIFQISERFYDEDDKRLGAHWMNIYSASVDEGLIDPEERPIQVGELGYYVELRPGDTLAIPRYRDVFPAISEVTEQYPVEVMDTVSDSEQPQLEPRTLTILHTDNLQDRFNLGFHTGIGLDDIAAAAATIGAKQPTILLDAGQPSPSSAGAAELYLRAVEAVNFDVRIPGPGDLIPTSEMVVVDPAMASGARTTQSDDFSGHALVGAGDILLGIVSIPLTGATEDPRELFAAATDQVLQLEARGAEIIVAVTQYEVGALFEEGYFPRDTLRRAAPFLDRVDLIIDKSDVVDPVYLDESTVVVSSGGLNRMGRVDLTLHPDLAVDIQHTFLDEQRLAAMDARAEVETLHELRRVAAAASLPMGDPRDITIMHADNLLSRLANGLTAGFGLDEVVASSQYAAERQPTYLLDIGQYLPVPPELIENGVLNDAVARALEIVAPNYSVPGSIQLPGESQSDPAVTTSAFSFVGDVATGVIAIPSQPDASSVDLTAVFERAVEELESLEQRGVEVVIVATQYPLKDLYQQGFFAPSAQARAAQFIDRVDIVIDGSTSTEPLYLDETTIVVSGGGLETIGAVEVEVHGRDVSAVTPVSINRRLLTQLGVESAPNTLDALWRVSVALGLEERVTLLHTSNVRSRLGDDDGSLRLDHVAAVREFAHDRAPTVLLDSGQMLPPDPRLQPSREAGIAAAQLLDRVGYDALVLGPLDRPLGLSAAEVMGEYGDLSIVSTNLAPGEAYDPVVPSAILQAGPVDIGVLGFTVTEDYALRDLARTFSREMDRLDAAGVNAIAVVTQHPVMELLQEDFFSPEELAWAESFRDRVSVVIDGSQPGVAQYVGDTTLVVSAADVAAMGGIDIVLRGGAVSSLSHAEITASTIAEAGIWPDPRISSQTDRVAGSLGLPVRPDGGQIGGDAPITPVEPGDGAVTFDPSATAPLGSFRIVTAPGISLYADTEGYGGSIIATATMEEFFGATGRFAPLVLGIGIRYDGALVNDTDYTLHNGGPALVVGWELNPGRASGTGGALSWLYFTPKVELGVMYQQKQHVGRVGYQGVAYYASPGALLELRIPFLPSLRIGARGGIHLHYGDSLITNAHVAPSISWQF